MALWEILILVAFTLIGILFVSEIFAKFLIEEKKQETKQAQKELMELIEKVPKAMMDIVNEVKKQEEDEKRKRAELMKQMDI